MTSAPWSGAHPTLPPASRVSLGVSHCLSLSCDCKMGLIPKHPSEAHQANTQHLAECPAHGQCMRSGGDYG